MLHVTDSPRFSRCKQSPGLVIPSRPALSIISFPSDSSVSHLYRKPSFPLNLPVTATIQTINTLCCLQRDFCLLCLSSQTSDGQNKIQHRYWFYEPQRCEVVKKISGSLIQSPKKNSLCIKRRKEVNYDYRGISVKGIQSQSLKFGFVKRKLKITQTWYIQQLKLVPCWIFGPFGWIWLLMCFVLLPTATTNILN